MTMTFLIVYPTMWALFATVVALVHARTVRRRAGQMNRAEWISACTWGFLCGMIWPLSIPLMLALVLTFLITGHDRGAL